MKGGRRKHKNRTNGEKERVEENGQEEGPKLDEGFFEVEAIRRKRVRKGQLQYLIKWRGWPETANTWEPLKNLQSCVDFVDAFEESLHSGKHNQKQKQKCGGPHTQSKKKQQLSSSEVYHASSVDAEVSTFPYSAPLNNLDLVLVPALVPDTTLAHEKENNENTSNGKTFKLTDINGSADRSVQIHEKELNDYDTHLSELQGAISVDGNVDKFATISCDRRPSENEHLANGISKNAHARLIQNNLHTGAKRRKSGSVKRFKHDTAPYAPSLMQNSMQNVAIGYGVIDTSFGIVYPGFTADNSSHIPKFDNPINPSAITKILRTTGFSVSMMDNVQDVLVNFTAIRSDGKEVIVDNRYLKANNPQLLINFYEQHLKYSPMQ